MNESKHVYRMLLLDLFFDKSQENEKPLPFENYILLVRIVLLLLLYDIFEHCHQRYDTPVDVDTKINWNGIKNNSINQNKNSNNPSIMRTQCIFLYIMTTTKKTHHQYCTFLVVTSKE